MKQFKENVYKTHHIQYVSKEHIQWQWRNHE